MNIECKLILKQTVLTKVAFYPLGFLVALNLMELNTASKLIVKTMKLEVCYDITG